MLRSVLTKLAVAVLVGAVAQAVIRLFGLDLIIERMVIDHPNILGWVGLLISAAVGLVGLGVWVALGLEDRLANWFSPRPLLGSLVYRDIHVGLSIFGERTTNLEVTVTLENKNPELISFTAAMHCIANGKRWTNEHGESVLRFNGFAAANGLAYLIMRMPDIPFQATAGLSSLEAVLDYEINYRFPSRSRARTTGRTIDFSQHVPVSGVPGTSHEHGNRVLFREERES